MTTLEWNTSYYFSKYTLHSKGQLVLGKYFNTFMKYLENWQILQI